MMTLLNAVFWWMNVGAHRLQTEAHVPHSREETLVFSSGLGTTKTTDMNAFRAFVARVVDLVVGRSDPQIVAGLYTELTTRALKGESLPPRR